MNQKDFISGYNFKFKKKYGQNFLIDDNVLNNIVSKSEIDKDTPGYYYHFHLGRDVKHKNKKAGHIFWGTSAVYNTRPQ